MTIMKGLSKLASCVIPVVVGIKSEDPSSWSITLFKVKASLSSCILRTKGQGSLQ